MRKRKPIDFGSSRSRKQGDRGRKGKGRNRKNDNGRHSKNEKG